jgi:hypothetical protein
MFFISIVHHLIDSLMTLNMYSYCSCNNNGTLKLIIFTTNAFAQSGYLYDHLSGSFI